ncbi:MAG: hypothetical protein D6E12_11835, partial [Desulfovibrio sp.]
MQALAPIFSRRATSLFMVLYLALALVMVPGTVWAGYDPDPVGYVQEADGDVVAINQDRLVKRWNHQEECRALAKGDPVFIGDLLVTG